MKQRTAKTVVEVLEWMRDTPHHWASAETLGFLILGNRDQKLRIPVKLLQESSGLYEAALGTRMFYPTPAGVEYLYKHRADTPSQP